LYYFIHYLNLNCPNFALVPSCNVSEFFTKKLYVLVMVDPDAKSRANPELACWQHWLVADIQGTSLRKGEIKGTTLADYRPPTPPSKSGFHRYQFMLFEQPADAQVTLTEEENCGWESPNDPFPLPLTQSSTQFYHEFQSPFSFHLWPCLKAEQI
uniref:Phosphatidylethanolamine binding protein 4 n=1 Tax=Periophthalmus magnuspinnatus TaxID=409849 RepID=A0A3B4ADV7_9GOBI